MNAPTLARLRVAALVVALFAIGLSVVEGQDSRNFPTIGKVHRLDPALDSLIEPGAAIEVLASGFIWSEGPVWDRKGGYLLFSDVPQNTVFKWVEGKGITVFLKPSGFTGASEYSREPGSNGLAIDSEGRLFSCEHGDRRVSVMAPGSGKVTVADHWNGKRFNSPNDLVIASNGDIYFTDPIYGLRGKENDPAREIDFCGVYRVTPEGEVSLISKEMSRPNGIALSPDEETLYVANSDGRRAIWMAFPLSNGKAAGPGKVFADVTNRMGKAPGSPDGFKVDKAGRLWTSGPGGIHVFSPQGKLLGIIDTGEANANCAFGGPDGSVLYITADSYLCRIQTKVQGLGF